MQKLLVPFFYDFRKEIAKSRYKKEIITLVLIGSAARDSFVKGQSDIDLIAVVKSREKKKEVYNFLRKSIKKLNKKHKLGLEKTLNDEVRRGLSSLISNFEGGFMFGMPLYVFSLRELDIAKAKVRDPKIMLLTTFVGAVDSILYNLKYSSKIIYGRNLLKQIQPRFSFYEKIKMAVQPYYLILFSLLYLLISPKQSVKHAMKACFWEAEFDLMLLHKKLGSYRKNEKAYEKIFFLSTKNIKHLRKTIAYRKKYEKLKISRTKAIKYIFNSLVFIAHTHGMMIKKEYKNLHIK